MYFHVIVMLGRGARRADRRECSGLCTRASHGSKRKVGRGVQLRVSRLRERHYSGYQEQREPPRAASYIRLRCRLRQYHHSGKWVDRIKVITS